jgi:hypothetical protein
MRPRQPSVSRRRGSAGVCTVKVIFAFVIGLLAGSHFCFWNSGAHTALVPEAAAAAGAGAQAASASAAAAAQAAALTQAQTASQQEASASAMAAAAAQLRSAKAEVAKAQAEAAAAMAGEAATRKAAAEQVAAAKQAAEREAAAAAVATSKASSVGAASSSLQAKLAAQLRVLQAQGKVAAPPAQPKPEPTLPHPSADLTATQKARSEKVKEAMAHTWRGYEKYAMGHDELLPQSGSMRDNWSHMAMTMLDGMDTLWIMGMKDEFKRARDWVASSLDFSKVTGDISLFETTIRAVGGLLSAHALSGDKVLADKAKELVDKMLPAFNSGSGIPRARVNLQTGQSFNYNWAQGAILAEFGSVQLELNELSRITGAPNYGEKGMKVFRVMQKARTEHGMFPLFADSERGTSIGSQIAFGGMGDSFYEYLLKVWLQTGRKHQWLRDMYDKAMDGMIEHVLQYSSPSHLAYIPNYNGGGLERKMDHLTCFMPGLLALGTVGMPDSARKTRDLRVAKEVMKTCWLMYHRTATGIAPEYVNFGGNDFSVPDDQPYYMLRPETIESLHVMHEVTGDPIYREWGWQIFESILKHCRAKYGFGHLTDVRNTQRPAEDKMESFWVAETLKYHYLLQTPGTGITNDKWVFNTEAHPLPMPKK